MAEGNGRHEDKMLDEVNKKLFRVLDINHKLEQTINTLFAEKETFRLKIGERNKILKDRLDLLEQKMLKSLDTVCNGQLASIQRKRNKCLDLANHTKTLIDRLKEEKESLSYRDDLHSINRILDRDLSYLGEGEERVSLYLMINDDLEQYVAETASISSIGGETTDANIAPESIPKPTKKESSPVSIKSESVVETRTYCVKEEQAHIQSDFLPATPEPPSYFDVVMPTFPFPHGKNNESVHSSKSSAPPVLDTPCPSGEISVSSDGTSGSGSLPGEIVASAAMSGNSSVDVISSVPPHNARLVSSFKTKTPTDKKCSKITGAAYLDNDRIAVTDRHNKKVKLFTETFDLMAECKLEEYPFDVTQTCLGNIAVSVTKMERVMFFDNSLETVLEELETHQPCLGVSARHDKLFVCCDGTWTDLGCIKVFDLKNQLLWKIDKDLSGKILIGNTKYIDVCPKSGNLYFTKGGFGKSTLYCINSPATVVWKSKLPSVSHFYGSGVPHGIAAINDGLLLAMSYVKCVTENGTKWEPFVDPSERLRINAVCVNQKQTLMAISQVDPASDCEENNLIRIYRLEH